MILQAVIPDLNLPYEEEEESIEASIPLQIVMACRACRLYMTVPSNNPKCLKCRKGTRLIDVSTELVHTKKKRRN